MFSGIPKALDDIDLLTVDLPRVRHPTQESQPQTEETCPQNTRNDE